MKITTNTDEAELSPIVSPLKASHPISYFQIPRAQHRPIRRHLSRHLIMLKDPLPLGGVLPRSRTLAQPRPANYEFLQTAINFPRERNCR